MRKNTTDTQRISLPKTYPPREAEERWQVYWEQHGLFHARANPAKKPYTIVIPPPNITGILTMGHVLNNTIQDILIRWKRMQGYEACWIPGTDHAGIATQNVVEKMLLKEGKTRHDLGREQFLERVWQWKEEYGSTIIKQLRKLGCSCDWERERFTMDEGLSNAVQEIFIRLYNKGLIYRGNYIVNWCPKDHTAISDDEVEHSETKGHLWFVRYPLENSDRSVVVATTRPETMLGDTALAVNPKDKRYTHLVGTNAILPIVGRKLPIVADEYVDPQFGTGIVKVTPAHDPNDFQIAQRHGLGKLIVMDTSARMNENVPNRYQGLDRFVCRKQLLKDLEDGKLLVKVEDHLYSAGRCYRCDTIIEPYLSDQWFVKMKPLAERALQVVLDGTIKYYPEHWVKTYEHWMTNIRDWCISRQLWWGHRIPVWYCTREDCDYMVASKTEPTNQCLKCGSSQYRQDDDVLDTWFSSWLWPFSTLNWPNDNAELRYFYPTRTLVTGPDIIFFWVARMIMSGLEVMGEIPLPDGQPRTEVKDIVPYHSVYFTSIIRDTKGRRMSKSLGNSPDPLDVIREYGADALRFSIVYLAPLGQDVLYSNEQCEIGRNFANKIWNAGRFLLLNRWQLAETPGETVSPPKVRLRRTPLPQTIQSQPSTDFLDLADRWVLSRLQATITSLDSALEYFRINEATRIVYDFIWHDYCDWYVEIIKERLYESGDATSKEAVLNRAFWIFEQALLLLHPFMPFLTEELWQNLGDRKDGESISVQPWPTYDARWVDERATDEMAFVKDLIGAVRNIRSEMNVPPPKECDVYLNCHDKKYIDLFNDSKAYLQRLAHVQKAEAGLNVKKPLHAASAVVAGQEVYIPLEGLIDLAVERKRLGKETSRVEGILEGIRKKLANREFVRKAPKEVVESERVKETSFRTTLEKLKLNYQALLE
ncbi:MAG: valine--tRNA ligase [Bacteroidota bacterium]